MEKEAHWSDKQLAATLRVGTGTTCELAQEYICKCWSGEALRQIEQIGGTREQFDAVEAAGQMVLERIVRRKNFDYQTRPFRLLYIDSVSEAWAINGLKKQDKDTHYIFAYAYVNNSWRAAAKKKIMESGGMESDFDEVVSAAMATLVRRVKSPRFLWRSSLEEIFTAAVVDEWIMAGWKKNSGKHYDAAYIYAWEQWKEIGRRSIEGLVGGKGQMDKKKQDFEDVFEDAFQKVFEQVKNKGIHLNHGGLNRYFAVVLIRTWSKNDENQNKITAPPVAHSSDNGRGAEDILHVSDSDVKRKMLLGWLDQLNERCKNILLFSQDHSLKELAEEFGWKNAKVAKKEKHKCMKRLLKILPKYLRDNYKPVKGRPRK